MYKYILIILVGALLTACGNIQFPGVYKITVEQGNIFDQKMINKLTPGMSKSQVEYILGSPLIKDTFNADRWDYLYTVLKGDDSREQKKLTVFFKDDLLDFVTGDLVPAAQTPPKA